MPARKRNEDALEADRPENLLRALAPRGEEDERLRDDGVPDAVAEELEDLGAVSRADGRVELLRLFAGEEVDEPAVEDGGERRRDLLLERGAHPCERVVLDDLADARLALEERYRAGSAARGRGGRGGGRVEVVRRGEARGRGVEGTGC